jgi:hypothetical protein
MEYKSEFNPILKVENGLRLIDPNPNNQQIVPLEDLFIYVKLKANQKSKTLLIQNEDGKTDISTINKNNVILSVPQEKVEGSQLFKTKPVLTTDWTEIGGFKSFNNEISGKDFEGFGITNIDIKIQSQTSPQIVIDFVDVRGATLFEQGSCSPYGLFFSLPYPIFELTLKGFYGRPINYYLNLVKFTSKFNPENGNMECRAEFVGYTFAFLADVIVGYVKASQRLPRDTYFPQEKLKDKYDSYANFIGKSNIWCGNPVSKSYLQCTTLHDLITSLNKFESQSIPKIEKSNEVNELDDLNLLVQDYREYIRILNELYKDLNGKNYQTDPTTVDINPDPGRIKGLRYRFLIPTTEDNNQLVSDDGIIYNYFNKQNGTLLNIIRSVLTRKINGNPAYSYANIKCLTKNQSQFDNDSAASYNLYDDTDLNTKPWFKGILKSSNKLSYPPVSNESQIDIGGNASMIDIGYLLADAHRELDSLVNPTSGLVTNKQKSVVESINNIIKNNIGFDPTIRNIFTVLLCNTDAFLEILKSVAERAEEYHKNENLTDLTQRKEIISGQEKVYSWPTYIEEVPKQSGTVSTTQKEVYPGKRFPTWPEVIFVEDFINAYLSSLEEEELLDNKTEGKKGYDNYVPINPLESKYRAAVGDPKPIKYLTSLNGNDGKDNILKHVGERMFLTLDHTYFQPARLTLDAFLIPKIKEKDTNALEDGTLIKKVGAIDAWNLLNALDKKDINSNIISPDLPAFKEDVKNRLKLETKSYTDIIRTPNITTRVPMTNFYVYGKEGIEIIDGITVLPNPHKMGVDDLFKIIPPEEQKSYEDQDKIKIDIKDFETERSTYQETITESVSKLNFSTTFFDTSNPNWPASLKGKPEWDDNTQIVSFDKAELFTTLASFYGETAKNRSWWGTGKLTNSEIPSMGSITYWDDEGFVNYTNLMTFTSVRDANGTSFLSNLIFNDSVNTKSVVIENTIKVEKNTEILPTTQIGRIDKNYVELSVATTTLVNTPLWLDNVNNFRKLLGDSFKIDEKDQLKNLAYLFLHTLKPTPLIKRFINNDGYLYNDQLDDEQTQSSVIWSLKAFNSVAGVVKVPKFWLLALGAQLWRWKEFVGVDNDTNVWNKTLIAENSTETPKKPTGKDPLIQPGWNPYQPSIIDYNNLMDYSVDGTPDQPQLEHRHNPIPYLNNIYGTNFNSLESIFKYKSVFGGNQNNPPSSISDYSYSSINDQSNHVYFNYFRYYKNKVGKIGQNILDPISIGDLVNNYAWPQVYIAPHHIPYISPEIFDEGNKGRGSNFTLLTFSWVGYQDYITMQPTLNKVDNGVLIGNYDYMETYPFINSNGDPQERNANNPKKLDRENVKDDYEETYRAKDLDGNLGMVMQYLPEIVKNKIVEEFEKWSIGDEWNNLLKIIDPIHFGGQSSHLMDSYEYNNNESTSPSVQGLGYSKDEDYGGYALALKENENLLKLLTEEYWILNSTPKIWYGIQDSGTVSNTFYDEGFIVSTTQFDDYLNTFHSTFITNKQKRIQELEKKEKEKNKTGNSVVDDDDLKLSLYRTFKSTTDKWISASRNGKLFFNMLNSSKGKYCGQNNSNNSPYKEKDTLASHFQYVNRTMGDIGDIAVIDITKLKEIRENKKITLYQYISNLLTDNEYQFFPLPTTINLTADGVSGEDLKDMFRPYLESVEDVSCGPSFICMYVGGNSRQLKMAINSSCYIDQEILKSIEDDSFSLYESVPPPEMKPTAGAGGYTAFKILYGLQNQNHFTSIQLDQSEFSETAESLMVVDKLSQQGDTEQTTKGQNLNAVNLTRSYTCNVESMGNMMIQPMTYFDLQGVPMFSGAYLITEVSHNFKPNNATTSFKGVRQPRATVPVVTDAAIAMNLTIKGTGSNGTSLGSIGGAGEMGGSNSGIIISKAPRQPGGKGTACKPNVTFNNSNLTELDNYGSTVGITDKGDDATLFKLNQPNKPLCNILNSAYANLNVSTRGVPHTGGGNLGCAAAVSIIFYRATGYALVNENAITIGTNDIYNHLEKLSKEPNPSWEMIKDWKTQSKPGDIICTARGSEPGHVGVVVNNNGVISNSSGGFKGDKKGQIELNYSINSWQSVADRNPSQTASFRYVGPYADKFEQITATGGFSSTNPKGDWTLNQIYTKLNDKIQNPNLVYGLMGNIQSESAFNNNLAGDARERSLNKGLDKGDPKFKYCSWGYTQMYTCGGAGDEFLKKYGLTSASDSEKIAALTNPDKHLDYVIERMADIFNSKNLPITKQDSVENWAINIAREYERCAGCDNPNSATVLQRVDNAIKLSKSGIDKPAPVPTATPTVPIGETIVIGDSQSPSIQSKVSGSKLGTEGSEWKTGWFMKNLTSGLNAISPNNNVKNVVVSIGTNGAYNMTDKFDELRDAIVKAYPKLDKVILVKGSWCWGNANWPCTTTSPCTPVDQYYSTLKSSLETKLAGKVKIVSAPIGCTSTHPTSNTPSIVTIGGEITSLIT